MQAHEAVLAIQEHGLTIPSGKEVNKDNVRLWVDALRSGEYEQGYRNLSIDGKYCCLGVACEVAMRNGVPMEKKECGGVASYNSHDAFLPVVVTNWLGLDECNPHGYYRDRRRSLSSLNDDGAFNFDDIADVIERTYLQGETDAWWDKETGGGV